MSQVRRVVLLTVLLVCWPAYSATDETLDHRIPPGYEPVQAEDELGLWMEMHEYEQRLRNSALLIRDPDLNDYLQEILCKVAAAYCGDFRVYLIRNPDFNASMTATGMMQIWTGLIVRANSTDEIAAVIGHEISHYTLLHSLETLRALKKRLATGTFVDIALILATGYGTGLGQTMAALSVMSFSREQETEADLLGVRLLAEAAYNPHASYGIWEKIIAEEEAAEVKRDKPGAFSKTHPDARLRAAYLKDVVTARHGPPDAEQTPDGRLLGILNNNYMLLMEDQLDTNRFGRTKELLERHAALGVEPSLVRFFYGEMFRQRGKEGDRDLARSAYLHSIEGGKAPAAAYSNLGYLYIKDGDTDSARTYFAKYLEIDPDASDREMIEFYLED
ncbi:MAG: M48 family metalloprotease [Gammaproteobacteria bacterium]|nr:M48 family metalloprotease [Gammaproteobacteria bacterium]MDH3362182.1 M48 family metalloprotease [Gammaproteobacteria bacterium]MDH3480704.1 M48 family metalloprotease [Gammaproteobacteria bacterium]